MPEPSCANCGSRRVNGLADAVGCEDCGAATNYDGELVHGPTANDAPPAGDPPPGMTTSKTVAEDLDALSRDQLRAKARAVGVSGAGSMTKPELIAALDG